MSSQNAIVRLKSLSFEGAGRYIKNTGPISLEKRGLVLIEGDEGSGKSTIPEVLTLIPHGKGSPRVREESLKKQTILNPMVGYLGTLSFESGMGTSLRDVKISQAFKHKQYKSKYEIFINGKSDDEPMTEPQQRKLVRKLFPLSYDEWLGTSYLPQGYVHDLLAGSPTEKKQYVTSVFGLDFCEDLLTEAQATRSELVEKAKTAVGLHQTLADLEKEVQTLTDELAGLPSDEDLAAAVQMKSKKMQDIAQEIGRLEALTETIDELHDARESFKAISAGAGAAWSSSDMSEKEDALERLTGEAAKLRAQLEDLEEQQDQYTRAVKEKARRAKVLKEAQDALDTAQKNLEPYKDWGNISNLMDLLTEALNLGIDNLRYEGESLPDEDWRVLVNEASAAEAQASKLEAIKEKLTTKRHGHDDVSVHCPTCSSVVDLEVLQKTADSLLKEAARKQRQAERKLGDAIPTFARSNNTKESVQALRKTVATVTKLFSALDSAEDDYKELQQVPDVKVPSSPPSGDEVEDRLASVNQKSSALKAQISAQRKLQACSSNIKSLERALVGVETDEVEAALVSLRREKNSVRESYEAAVVARDRRVGLASSLKSSKKQRDQIKTKVDEGAADALKLKMYDEELIPYLVAFRAGKVHSALGVLEGVLPVYVNAISTGSYLGSELRLKASDDLSKIEFEMKIGSSSEWVTPLQASGGQRRRFTVATIAALIETSPRTTNNLWFDEPFSDLQREGKLALVNRLIPTLMERCPSLESVFLIAHDLEVLNASNDTFDDVWCIRNDEYGSSLTQGNKLSDVRRSFSK